MTPDFTLLDNPIWHALRSKHQVFSVGTPKVKKYQYDVLPFMGMEICDEHFLHELLPFMQKDEEVFIGGNIPNLPANWEVCKEVNCLQMVCEKPFEINNAERVQVEKLEESNHDEMLSLISHVLPGYFTERTPLIGNYYGIREEGKLVAIGGERFQLDGFCELSAICTHPDYIGRGFARQLMQIVVEQIFTQGMLPFLHVENTNERAIRLYEFLGFKKRIDFPFIKIKVRS